MPLVSPSLPSLAQAQERSPGPARGSQSYPGPDELATPSRDGGMMIGGDIGFVAPHYFRPSCARRCAVRLKWTGE